MGLQAIAKKAAKVAFNAAGDAIALANYREKTQGVYDPATDSQGETTSDTEINLLFDSSKLTGANRNLVEQMTSGQRIALILAEDLPTPPKTDDKIVFNGDIYDIVAVAPADPLPEPVMYNLLLELVK